MLSAVGLPCAGRAETQLPCLLVPRRWCLLLRLAASREPAHCTVRPSVRHGEAAGAELGCSSGCWVSASGPSSHYDASKSGALPSCGRGRPGLLSSETLTFSAAELFGRSVWGKLILSNFSV